MPEEKSVGDDKEIKRERGKVRQRDGQLPARRKESLWRGARAQQAEQERRGLGESEDIEQADKGAGGGSKASSVAATCARCNHLNSYCTFLATHSLAHTHTHTHGNAISLKGQKAQAVE